MLSIEEVLQCEGDVYEVLSEQGLPFNWAGMAYAIAFKLQFGRVNINTVDSDWLDGLFLCWSNIEYRVALVSEVLFRSNVILFNSSIDDVRLCFDRLESVLVDMIQSIDSDELRLFAESGFDRSNPAFLDYLKDLRFVKNVLSHVVEIVGFSEPALTWWMDYVPKIP